MSYKEVADISSYQPDTVAYMKSLRKYADSVIVKLTEGSESGSAYFNAKAPTQVANAFAVFPTVGAYHYFLGNSQAYGDNDPVNEAKWFYKKLLSLGLDKTTVCVIDVEDKALQKYVTHDINLFLKYLAGKGYTNLMVYASGSWFTSGRINKDALYNNTPIWVAAYDTDRPGVDGAAAWQYTDNGHGLHTDFSYDFTGALSGVAEVTTEPGTGTTTTPGTSEPETPIENEVGKFLQESGRYTITADSVPVYTDPTLSGTAGESLAKGSSLVCVPADKTAHSLMISRDMYITADTSKVKYVKG